MKYLYFFLLCVTFVFSQNQIGSNLFDEEFPTDGLSRPSIKISTDGNTLAFSTTNGSNSIIRVFNRLGNNWVQKGSNIITALGNNNISSISMSNNGNIISVGIQTRMNTVMGFTREGFIKIFEWDGTDWNQKGNTINIGEGSFYTGVKNAISGNGNIIAAVKSIENENDELVTYEWDGSNWIADEGYIYSESSIGYTFGTGININTDGDVISFQYLTPDANNNEYDLKIFKKNTSNWVQLGNDFHSIYSFTMSNNGENIAISTLNNENSAITEIHNWNGVSWNQVGSGISNSGIELELDDNGDYVSISYRHNSPNVDLRSTKLFKFESGDWTQLGNDINSQTFDSIEEGVGPMGSDLSSNGTILSLMYNNGSVKVFEFDESTLSLNNVEKSDNTNIIFPNPTTSYVNIQDKYNVKIANIYSSNGNLVKKAETNKIDLSEFPQGIYLIEIITKDNRIFRNKVIKK